MQRIYTIDFETTGVDPTTCHPVEVALYGVDRIYHSLIRPPCKIPVETSAIHHIIDSDVEFSPDWEYVRRVLIEILSDGTDKGLPILVAHNASYEQAILNKPIEAQELPAVLWICTYKCALRVWPDAPSHKNEVLRYWLGIGDDLGRDSHQLPHSAEHDARITFGILQALLKHANIEQLVEWTELPAKLPRMPMGKHFGQAWDTIPGPYLQWCISQADMREDVKACAKEELDRRKKGNATQRSS